ncbi:zinc-binding alcohol dehydrogenase family protein [Mucilaginibacter sp.]|jgi:NADPH:quinone reductase-like Zn-dependent oxidoreductase|uniref:quinone oxidoreductase family protein n=1 Tax=Mucilaginibacter sp. TaxID=1882438 RepID=UPI00356255DB
MKAIVFDHIGAPGDVLYLADIPLRDIKDNEVLVRMVASSVIPGDFLFMQNMYPEPKKPVFPKQISGNHGSGIIEKTGKHVKIEPGSFVFFTYYNSWAEYAIVPAERLIALPKDYPPLKASQLVNLITAWDLIDCSGVKKGQWLVLTAGYSTVSLLAAQFARRLGIKVISVVRRQQENHDYNAASADAIINLSALTGPLTGELRRITSNAGINGVIDNVGGPALVEMIKSAVYGSKIIINGNMSLEKFALHNNDILFNGIEIRPYVYRYLLDPPKEADKAFLDKIISMSAEPDFTVKIGGTHKLDDYKNAVSGTLYEAEKGKHVFVFDHDLVEK